MPTFITIGYGDEAGYRRVSDECRQAAHARDDELSASGALIGRAGDPVQVRNPDGSGVRVEDRFCNRRCRSRGSRCSTPRISTRRSSG
jgi:hypothetical protein